SVSVLSRKMERLKSQPAIPISAMILILSCKLERGRQIEGPTTAGGLDGLEHNLQGVPSVRRAQHRRLAALQAVHQMLDQDRPPIALALRLVAAPPPRRDPAVHPRRRVQLEQLQRRRARVLAWVVEHHRAGAAEDLDLGSAAGVDVE